MKDLKKKLKRPATWSEVLIITLIASLIMSATKCASDPNAPEFKWNPKIYVGDSRSQSIVRKNQQIKCSDPEFDEMVAVHKSEIRKAKEAAFDVINQCESWKSNYSVQDAVTETEATFGAMSDDEFKAMMEDEEKIWDVD